MKFELSEKQVAMARAFIDAQPHVYLGAIGGETTFEFTMTTVGTATRVIFCKGMPEEASLDLTDYSEW